MIEFDNVTEPNEEIEFNEGIMRKVEDKERELGYLGRCLSTLICPKCGEKLKTGLTYDEVLPDEAFECTSCSFTIIRQDE